MSKKNISRLSALLIALFLIAPAAEAQRAQKSAAKTPAPRDLLGFTPGDDRRLASWAQIVDYFKRLDQSSDRMTLEEIGRTTLDRPFVAATFSSPANLARISRFKEIQRRLADPRMITDAQAEELIREGKTIVLITLGIHSTEVGGPLASMNIAYKLASDDSPDTREILDKCIILIVPSLNPDGVDIVKKWYDRTLGTPAEGTGPTELYHHYTGHDNNRDWYAFTQVETQLTVDKLHNQWHPQIVHDIHQQGEGGTRFFIPPYTEPWEPNVSPILQAGVNFMGSSMAWELTAEGKTGVVINAIYDAWTPARAYQHYHGGIRILSETASARLATPTKVEFANLTNQINVDTKTRSWNFPAPWKGGEWKLANIVDYMQSGAFALMRNSARYRERWLRDFYFIGREAVRERKAGEAFAFLLHEPKEPDETAAFKNPAVEWQKHGLERIEAILKRGQVEIINAASSFEAAGKQYPAGTRIVMMSQPYGSFAKTLLERQRYPDLREYPGGPPRRPYDVTAHTLPLLMGVDVTEIDQPFRAPQHRGDGLSVTEKEGRVFFSQSKARTGLYKSYSASMDEGWTRWIFDQHKMKYTSLVDGDIRAGNLRAKYDCIIFPEQGARQIVEGLAKNRYPAEVAGGIGAEGVAAIKKFIEEGGTVVTLNDSSEFAIEHLDAPVKNILRGVSNRDFYCPGSILKIEFDAKDPLATGLPALESKQGEGIAWFETGPAFETTSSDARIVARFAASKDVLLSGWLLGADKIGGRGAIVEVKRGQGRIIMFAFRPQYRGQTVATFPLLFNAIQTSAPER